MGRKLISSGSEFEAKIGYSRAVVDDNYVFVSGTTGYNYKDMTISSDVLEQTNQCFLNIQGVLNEAGTSINNVVRVTYIFPNKEDVEKCWPIMSQWLGEVRPAATMFIAGLLDEKMKIEIQVTAKLSD